MKDKGISSLFTILGIILVLGIASGAYYLGTRHGISPSTQLIQKTENSHCSDSKITGYKIASIYDFYNHSSKSAELTANLKGDNNQESIKIYAQTLNTQSGEQIGRNLPVTTKIFSDLNCLKEEFSYTGKDPNSKNDRSGNELNDAKVIPNFWGDGKDVLMVENESTGYGSGFAAYMNLITYKNGSYSVINGPTLGELSLYKFNGNNGVGNEILIATGIWERDESHFQEHRYKFEKLVWDGKQYNNVQLGTTKNKYLPDSANFIDQIIRVEPNVLLPV